MDRENEILESIIEKTPQNFGIEIDQALSAMREFARERSIGALAYARVNEYFINGAGLWENDDIDNNEMLTDDQLYTKYLESINKKQ